MKRIRYKVVDAKLVSNPIVQVNRLVVAELDPMVMSYAIRHGDEVLATGSAPNLAQLKKLTKLALSKMGVVFDGETRLRGSRATSSTS